MLIAAPVEMLQFDGEAKEEAQLLEPEVGLREVAPAVARVGRLDQRLQHVERGRLDAVAEQEFLRLREALDGFHQPVKQLEVRFHCGASAAGVVGHGGRYDGTRVMGRCWIGYPRNPPLDGAT